MDLDYIKNLSTEDRRDLLSADALSVVEEKYTRPLTKDEVVFYKDELAEASIHQAILLDDFKRVKDEWKEKLKPVAQRISTAIKAVKFRAVECEGRLYRIADIDKQQIHIIDEHGNLINTRPMLPDERQLTIHAIKHQAS